MSFSKINPSAIVREHVQTLRDDATRDARGPKVSDVLVHMGVPVVAAALVAFAKVRMSDSGVALVITALSVFVGLLFNLLVLATSLRIADSASVRHTSGRRLSREVLVNIEYAIAVAFSAIVVLLPATIEPADWTNSPVSRALYMRVATALVVGLVGIFIVTLLMVLKRMHVVIDQHFRSLADEERAAGGTAMQRIAREKAEHRELVDLAFGDATPASDEPTTDER